MTSFFFETIVELQWHICHTATSDPFVVLEQGHLTDSECYEMVYQSLH